MTDERKMLKAAAKRMRKSARGPVPTHTAQEREAWQKERALRRGLAQARNKMRDRKLEDRKELMRSRRSQEPFSQE